MVSPTEADLLTQFERQFPTPYKDYYLTKRNNLFASIQNFSKLWECFMVLDKIFCREFEDMDRATDLYKGFALLLFMNAHAKMRIAMELGLSSCLMEAHSIVRDSIESCAHGYRIQDPMLLEIWLKRDDGPPAQKAYKKEFWDNKAQGLFKGLDQLYGLWKQYSEIGSHTNVVSVSERFTQHKTETDVQWMLNYTGTKPDVLAASLAMMLMVFDLMENVIYKVYEDRLKLDDGLDKMRTGFHKEKEIIRQKTMATLKQAVSTGSAARATVNYRKV
jgi:hypothetical protein